MANLTLQQKRQTGAFYTPPHFADEAVQRMKRYLGDTLDGFTFYDPACGEGALLEALRRAGVPPENIYGSTLEEEDVRICQQKGLGTIFQRDFLEHPNINLPQLPDAGNARFVVFTNPPYMKLRKGVGEFAKRKYGTHDAEFLFLYRIIEELQPVCVGIFNKMGVWQGATGQSHRDALDLYNRFADGFMTCSSDWEGLSSGWGISFSVLGWCIGYVGTGVGYDIEGYEFRNDCSWEQNFTSFARFDTQSHGEKRAWDF